MCWSGQVLGVTRRKKQVVLSLPQKEQLMQHSPRPLGQRQQSLFPNLSFSETEWLHLHSDTAKSADTAGTTVVSEKSKLLALVKGETNSGKQDPTITKKICSSVCVLLRSLEISDQKLSWKLQLVKITCNQDLDPTISELHLLKRSRDTQHS